MIKAIEKQETPLIDNFIKIILSVITGLIATGVAGLWTLSRDVAKLEERIANWTATYQTSYVVMQGEMKALNHRIDGLTEIANRHSVKIDHIEKMRDHDHPAPSREPVSPR